MKRIWKTMFAAMLMSLAVCLFAGTAASAETVSGEIAEGFTWSYDTETKTLTLKGEGEIPEGAIPSPRPWEEYKDSLDSLVLDGVTGVGPFREKLGVQYSAASGSYGTISWKTDVASATVTITGSGEVSYSPWTDLWDFDGNPKINYIISNGITGASDVLFSTGSIQVGKDFQRLDPLKQASGPVTIAPDNPNFASYEGCIYSKDMTKLLYCPYCIEEPKLYSGIKTISSGAFDGNNAYINTLSLVVIPWGVTTIEDGAFSYIMGTTETWVVLPDTITYMTKAALPGKTRGTGCLFVYHRDNAFLNSVIYWEQDSFSTMMANPVDSLAQYYPGQETESSAPAETGPSSEPSAPASSGSSDAKPADKPSGGASSSQPQQPSQPAESSSKPTQTASKPAPAASSAPESSAAEPSSQIAESHELSEETSSAPESSEEISSVPESDAAEISEESAEDSSSPEESDAESSQASGTGRQSLSWIIPLVFALGAMAAAAAVIIFVIWKRR